MSAGNTGGAMTAGILHVGRVRGIMRPALIGPFPTVKGVTLILDMGANADVRPEHMQQFAIMGQMYSQTIMGIENPSVRLLSNGEEAGKGNQLVIARPSCSNNPWAQLSGQHRKQGCTQGSRRCGRDGRLYRQHLCQDCRDNGELDEFRDHRGDQEEPDRRVGRPDGQRLAQARARTYGRQPSTAVQC